uniref:NACHT LRR and PYD domain-containing protein n=1 Tax=Anabas testudineus TaxID=64144 RepID=A0A7N6B0P1_ANATE
MVRLENSPEIVQRIIKELTEMYTCFTSPDRSINIFHCLIEMNDQSVYQEIQEFLKSDNRSDKKLSEIHCSALAYMLLMSEEVLDELDLKKYNTSIEGRRRLIPVVRNCRMVRLFECDSFYCKAVATALKSNPSHLRELYLSTENHIQDSNAKLLPAALGSPHCRLEILRFHTGMQQDYLSFVLSALKSSTHLRELDLSDNILSYESMKHLSEFVESRHCKLEILRLQNCGLWEISCASLASAVTSNPCSLRELDLSKNRSFWNSLVKTLFNENCKTNWRLEILRLRFCTLLKSCCVAMASALKSTFSNIKELDLSYSMFVQDSEDDLLSELMSLESKNQLESLTMKSCRLTDRSCAFLASALSSPFSKVRELDLSNNELQDSGVELLSAGLESPHCRLETLRLCSCELSESCYASLRFPHHLKELDLSENNLQDSGVELLCDSLKSPDCELETLRLMDCRLSEKDFPFLVSALKSNPSRLKNLDLSDNKLQDSAVTLLSDFLQSSDCELVTLRLDNCGLSEISCTFLASALKSNALRDLDLSHNALKDSGVKLLFSGLESPNCRLQTLRMVCCEITEESCTYLVSGLKYNSCLRELDLSENNLQDSGMRVLSAGLENCSLQTLRLVICQLTDISASLASAPKSSSLPLKELELSYNKLQDSGMKLLCDFLESPHSSLEILGLESCELSDTSCTFLAPALRKPKSNLSGLKELDLSHNNLQDTGVQRLSDGLGNVNCRLKILRMNNCSLTEASCASLASALKSNPSHLTELELSHNDLKDSGVKLLSLGLESPHCRLQTLRLRYCNLTGDSYGVLKKALWYNPSHLRELDLSFNEVESIRIDYDYVGFNPGIQPCKLETVRFTRSHFSIDNSGDLIQALRYKKSSLKELDLSFDLNSPVKVLFELLESPLHALETLRTD